MKWIRRQKEENRPPHEHEAATRARLQRQDAAVAREARERSRAGSRLVERAVFEQGVYLPPSHIGFVVPRSDE
jgi:hypothetical protein